MQDEFLTGTLLPVLGIVFCYLLPTLIMVARRHPETGWFARVNLLLGWTGFAWLYVFWNATGWIDRTPAPEPVVLDPPKDPAQSSSGKTVDSLERQRERGLLGNEEDGHDARPEITSMLNQQSFAELFHEESGVRVQVELQGAKGYRLRIPTAALDPRRGQKHRARQALEEIFWRLEEKGASNGKPEDLTDEKAQYWELYVDSGDSSEAADVALRLHRTIAELPANVKVDVLRQLS